MSFLSKSTAFLFVKLMPVVLVLALSIFWSNEKNLRLSLERKSAENTTRLLEAEDRVQILNRELQRVQTQLEIAENNAASARQQNDNLIQQLGNRDEHIRRLLGEMIQMISGKQNVDLGKIAIKTKPEDWRAVRNELSGLMTAPPLVQGFKGSPQVYIETQHVMQGNAMAPALSGVASAGVSQLNKPRITFTSKSSDSEKPKEFRFQNDQNQTRTTDSEKIATINFVAKDNAIKEVTEIVAPKTKASTSVDIKIIAKEFGEVMVVNEDHNFVVISKGLDHGLKEGTNLWIYKGENKLAKLEVETAYKKICAATIIEGNPADLNIGDFVYLQENASVE